MRFLFINAIDHTRAVQTEHPPLGIGYLVSALRGRYGPDAIEFKVVDRNIEQEIAEWQPSIVGITAVSQNWNLAMAYADQAKMHKVPQVWVGGVHISMLPETLVPEMDVGMIGEGEVTICDLMDAYLTDRDLSTVDGIVYWRGGDRIQTKAREQVKDLDSLAPPARELFPKTKHAYMFTSRGCWYRCVFCASSRFWGSVRMFSAEYVVNEIESLVRGGVERVSFLDDIFPLNLGRVKECVRLLEERGLLGKVSFTCSVRANLVTPELVKLLKQMGVTYIGIGFESGNDQTLSYLKGRGLKVEHNLRAITLIRGGGIEVGGPFIIGSPGETLEDARETLGFIKRHHIPSDLYLLTPYPGTPVWNLAELKHLVSKHMDWSRLDIEYDGREDPIILTSTMTKREIDSIFSSFKKMKERQAMKRLVKAGLEHPERVPGWLLGGRSGG